MPQLPVDSMVQGIQDINHHIRTSYGIFNLTLSKRNTDSPFQGILQRNGTAPTTWVLISVSLLNMLRAKGHRAKFISAISRELTHIVGYMFVDDTDSITFDMFEEKKNWEDLTK